MFLLRKKVYKMKYVRLAVPQELYSSLGFCPEMALLPSSDTKSIKIVPMWSTSQLPSSSDLSVSRINFSENSGSFTEKNDNIVGNASTIPSDLDSNNQTVLCKETSVKVDSTPAIDERKGNKNGDAPHSIGMDSCQNLPSDDHRYQMIEGDSVEESNNSFGYREGRESLQGKILESKHTVNIPISINSLDQGCASNDTGLVSGLFDLSSKKIEKCSYEDPVSCEESSIDGYDSSESQSESDSASESEYHLNPPQNSVKVMNEHLQSDCKIVSSKKTKLNVEPQSNKIPFIEVCDNCCKTYKSKKTFQRHKRNCERFKAELVSGKKIIEPQSNKIPFRKVCDNCCRTYLAKKTFQRHKKNCERFKAELVSGKVRKARGSVKKIDEDIISDVGLKGPKTINHSIWKKGPSADITCEKCHWKFFSLHRYERHLTYCKTLQTRGTDILDNSIEKDKSVKWIHAPTGSTKKAQQYFVLRK